MNHSPAQTNDPRARFNADLFGRMRIMHREWLRNAQDMRQLEVDYGAKLSGPRPGLCRGAPTNPGSSNGIAAATSLRVPAQAAIT